MGWQRMFLVVAVSIVLTSCGGGMTERTTDGYTIYVHGGSLLPRGGEDALIEGRLAIHDGCVGLEQDPSGDIYPVVWPSGTSIASTDPLTLELRSGDTLGLGEGVTGGGGYHHATSDRIDVVIPSDCLPNTGEVAVFNPDAELTPSG